MLFFQAVGIAQFRGAPRFIAKSLGLDEETVLEFKGHSLRSSTATVMADMGATLPQIRNKLNHKSDKVS